MKSRTVFHALTALLLLVALPASAHVGVSPEEVTSGATSKFSFRIGHGCEGSPTERVTIEIPAEVASVKPQPKPGWEISLEEGPLEEPVMVHGQEVTEGVVQITWEGGPLEDAYMDEFSFTATVSADPGGVVYFPVIQECESGEHRWVQIPASEGDEVSEPAPAVAVAGDDGEGEGEGVVVADAADGSDLAARIEALEADSSDGLVTLALVLGGLGLLSGLVALVVARR